MQLLIFYVKIKLVIAMYEKFYNISKSKTANTTNKNFYLHNHDFYEILFFLQGDSSYIIEGNTYKLNPYDLIIQRKNEMHRVYHNSVTTYERVILWIRPEFFEQFNCKELEEEFLKQTHGSMNKIDAELCISSGLYDAFMRIQKYSNNFKEVNSPVVSAVIIEILYLINNAKLFSNDGNPDTTLKSVISYINSHYTDDISLDELAEQFFITKYHLCRIFKEGTGITVHNYITNKRLMRVRELKSEGHNMGEAAMLAGFGNYSSFYRAYQKNYGFSPSEKITEK